MKWFLVVLLSLSALDFSAAATLTVTNTNDSGPGSLRQAIADAADGDTIDFDLALPAVIPTSGLGIGKSLTITGPGARDLTIKGVSSTPENPDIRVLDIGEGPYDVTISGLTMAYGTVYDDDGGGLYNSSSGAVELRDCVLTDNEAYYGSGLANEGTGHLTLTKCTLSNNQIEGPGSEGGGIYNTGNLTVNQCTISENTCYSGSGIYNSGSATVTNSTITRNMSSPDSDMGGGITNADAAGAQILLSSCTVYGNWAAIGSNIESGATGTVTLRNTIVADAYGSSGIDGKVISEGYNLIASDDGTIEPMTGDQIGTFAAPIDPLLGRLQDNGGATQTRALKMGSPAIDKGKSFGLTTDQRGFFRPVDVPGIPPAPGGDNSDIGAYEKQAAQPLNLSTRANVLTGDKILDAGFIISGSDAKQVIIRGLGPSLGQQGLSGFLADPVLELHDSSGAILATNDNWQDSQEDQIKATGLAPKNNLESAIVETLDPGSYTAILSGKSDGTGIGLVEIYDLDQGAVSSLDNTSTRGFVGTEDDVMISGFILGAGEDISDRILVRGLGPSLRPAVAGALADPALELHDANGTLIASNNNWQDTQAQAINGTGLAPHDPKEAAILRSLPAGAYTTIVRGEKQTTGIALLEIYNLH